MAQIRFRKRVRVLPFLWLNFGTRGLNSVSIGTRGLSLNIGRQGVYFGAALIGTGLSYRTKLNKTDKNKGGDRG